MIVSRGILGLVALAYLGLESSQAFTIPIKTTHTSYSLFATQEAVEEDEKKVPITLLAGFLGSGKTTTLENLLKNNEGQKIGIVVNDVASINIDNKLLANPDVSSSGGTIELQNGCACCSLSDELLTSIEQLMTAEDGTQRDFDSIVVELSGVADPKAVRDNWENASWVKHPATKYATMDKVVTLVDADTFGTDWMTWDTSGDRDGWVDPADCEADKKVPELLSEQIESADVLVINKIDLAGEEQTKVATSLARY
jgi:G3E family GTPase